MDPRVTQALAAWDMAGADVTLAARRENTVYRVMADGSELALRLHRPGYRSDAQLRSELQWMAYLVENGFAVPRPRPARDGALVHTLDGVQVDMLSWLPGRPLGHGDQIDHPDPITLCENLGAQMARLHDLTDAWQPPEGFDRPDWGAEALLGDAPLWGRFWDHPHLTGDQRALLKAARDAARADLDALDPAPDVGLIHADLLAENMLIDGPEITFIDFDDAAFGYRDFELATFLLRYVDRPDFLALCAALCAGYARRRRVDDGHLDLLLTIRALTYVGWIADRLGEPGTAERSARAIDRATRLSRRYLDRRSA
ncbi:Ser/Thr protein kinase RdoA involved in Cpx stress response, MazF antagonist [Salinihabitans flavidus]|uniref:Ser/Thr protein kinase RdoA involved in Cpx stress response, MazF antagonist n=2 Tax=Salinihabitans flavidus TaxID=569882 RepID=A0A1H8U3H3_9RHOB|nr:Ser/Thr protein kinase RdoA involved in Cpx stress response, MazF antagonist [Salinihabitans flavidus]